jgi:hypothetical protein
MINLGLARIKEMKSCHLCGNDLTKWNLDALRELTCDLCVQWALMQDYPDSQIPAESSKGLVAPRSTMVGTPTNKKWDRAKNPLTWRDML